VNPNLVGETLATLTARRDELQQLRATLVTDREEPLAKYCEARLSAIIPEITRLKDSYWREAERPIRKPRRHPMAGNASMLPDKAEPELTCICLPKPLAVFGDVRCQKCGLPYLRPQLLTEE